MNGCRQISLPGQITEFFEKYAMTRMYTVKVSERDGTFSVRPFERIIRRGQTSLLCFDEFPNPQLNQHPFNSKNLSAFLFVGKNNRNQLPVEENRIMKRGTFCDAGVTDTAVKLSQIHLLTQSDP